MKNFRLITLLLAALVLAGGCVTTKKKGQEVGRFKKGYHNLTSKFNYWFNADELLRLTMDKQSLQYKDNYNQILELYPYAAADPQPARGDYDNVILKSSKAIALHRPSDWTDDCYTMIGQGQFLKRDFETAEATFKYIREELDPHKTKPKVKKSSKKKKKESVKKKKKSKKKAAKKKKKNSKKKKSSKKKSSSSKSKTADKSKTTDTKTKPAADAKKDAKKKEQPATPPVTGINPYKKGWKRTSAYPLAMIWYGRTLIEREKYDEAEFLYRDLYEDPWFPQSLKDDLATAEAYLWIKQKKYDRAIEPLARAIELTRRKKDRARMAFILAQIYERAGRHEESYAAYETVLRSRPAYDMEFNARLSQLKAGWANGKTTGAEATKSLERMAREEKNKEYRDQVYFVMAEIALKEDRKKDAIGYLRQSLAANVNNTPQRGESYLLLGDLYFEAEDFVQAKNYYDSTLTVMQATDTRYGRVTTYSKNLTDIARLITTIAENDSIVRIYNMDETSRKELAKSIKKQREAEAQAEAAAQAAKTQNSSKAPTPQAGAKPSNFYFYNDAFLKKGKKDFNKLWGARKLEDNWRRSNRVVTSDGDDAAAKDSTQANAVSDADLNSIFQGIPKNEAELAVIHLATYEAMFKLGTLFRDKLENYRRSAITLEDLQARYPDTAKHEQEVWYYCYLDFNDLNNPQKAQYYLDKLSGKYPNSPYTRALTDPNFLNASRAREREMTEYYEQTYAQFQTGQYQTAYERCLEAPKKYGSTNPLMPKFALLSALCVGNLQGNEAYCKALSEVIGRYPESAEATRAKEIARLLSCKGFETDDKKKNDQKGPMDDAFTREDDKLHYFIVSLSGSDIKLDDVKASIADYNREFHKTEQLRISNIFLGTDTNTPIVVIRKFDNKEQAMRYLNEVKDKKDFLGEGKKTYNKELFVITQENYRRVLKNKTLDGYREFFQDNYLK